MSLIIHSVLWPNSVRSKRALKTFPDYEKLTIASHWIQNARNLYMCFFSFQEMSSHPADWWPQWFETSTIFWQSFSLLRNIGCWCKIDSTHRDLASKIIYLRLASNIVLKILIKVETSFFAYIHSKLLPYMLTYTFSCFFLIHFISFCSFLLILCFFFLNRNFYIFIFYTACVCVMRVIHFLNFCLKFCIE